MNVSQRSLAGEGISLERVFSLKNGWISGEHKHSPLLCVNMSEKAVMSFKFRNSNKHLVKSNRFNWHSNILLGLFSLYWAGQRNRQDPSLAHFLTKRLLASFSLTKVKVKFLLEEQNKFLFHISMWKHSFLDRRKKSLGEQTFLQKALKLHFR